MIDYDKFRLSLKRLEEQYQNHREQDDTLPDLTERPLPSRSSSVLRPAMTACGRH